MDNSKVEPLKVTSKNIFQPLTNLEVPVFDRFENNNSSAGVVFDGVGTYLDPENQFVFPILRAESTTVSVGEGKEEGDPVRISNTSGEQLTLVAGYQTRYNNRAAIAGSTKVCTDEVMV